MKKLILAEKVLTRINVNVVRVLKEKKDEEIVSTEREFDDITGGEFQRGIPSLPERQQSCKNRSQKHPERGPGNRMARAHGLGAAMEDTQIEREHQRDKYVE